MFKRLRRYRRTKDQRRMAELESENDLLRRQLIISQAECESLSLVVARDRERVKAELATFARATAAGQQ
jgi:hypothetical protein